MGGPIGFHVRFLSLNMDTLSLVCFPSIPSNGHVFQSCVCSKNRVPPDLSSFPCKSGHIMGYATFMSSSSSSMALGAASADGFGLRRRLAPGGSATFRPWEAQMFRDFLLKPLSQRNSPSENPLNSDVLIRKRLIQIYFTGNGFRDLIRKILIQIIPSLHTLHLGGQFWPTDHEKTDIKELRRSRRAIRISRTNLMNPLLWSDFLS